MSVADTDELVLGALSPDGDGDGGPGARSLSELADSLGSTVGSLSGQIELATTLDRLRSAGMIERVPDEDGGGDARFVLTSAGESKTARVRERLADTEIDVVERDGRRALSLSEAAAELERPLVELAADCTDDGVYYRSAEPSPERVVGRDSERERCRSVLERVRSDGGGRALFLAGAGGVGKTALGDAIVTAASDDGFETARAKCGRSDDPYGPLRELLEALDVSPSPFEDVGPLDDERDDHEDFRTRQTALFYDVTEALAPSDAATPRLLYLDDLHLADAGTTAYLEYLLEHLSDRPLALVGSYRPAELPDDAPVARDVAPDDAPITRVQLDALDREATRGVIERVLERRGAPDDFVDAVFERTGGNPLFTEAVVTTLLDTGKLDPHFEWYPSDPDEIEVPDAVSETIDRHVAALDDDARELLQWAALIGERVPVDVLERVCVLPPARFETLLDALVGAGVVERVADRDAVTFRNEVVVEVLCEDLPDDERRERHASIARALEAGRDGSGDRDGGGGTDSERAAAIAEHRERAGDIESAVEWYRRAGERATDVYAHAAGVEHYHSALALARDGDDRETVLDLSEKLAKIFVVTGDVDRAERHVAFVRERSDDVARRQRIAALDSRIAAVRGDHEAAIERAEEGLALDETPSRLRCRLLERKSSGAYERSEFDRAAEIARQYLELAETVDAPDLVAWANQKLGSIAWAEGRYETAEDRLREGLETFRRIDERRGVATTQRVLGVVARNRGDNERAHEAYRDALEAAEAVGDRRETASTRMNLGVISTYQGDLESAGQYLSRALEEFRSIGDPHRVAVCRLNLGILAIYGGDYDTAERRLRTVLEEGDDFGDRRLVAEARGKLGEIVLERGEYDAADQHLADALEVNEEIGFRSGATATRIALGRTALARGALDESEARFRRAFEDAREIDNPRLTARVRTARAELEIERGEFDDAAADLRAALDAFEDVDDRLGAATARSLWGRVALERGEYETAGERLRDALDVLEKTGDRQDAARARTHLGELAIARGEDDAAARQLERALETFEEIGAAPGALETIELLVDHRLERGTGVRDDDVRELLERAEALLEDCEGDLETHRERISQYRSSLEDVTPDPD